MTTSPTPDDIATKCSKCGGPFEMGQAFQGHETATWHSICPPNPDSLSQEELRGKIITLGEKGMHRTMLAVYAPQIQALLAQEISKELEGLIKHTPLAIIEGNDVGHKPVMVVPVNRLEARIAYWRQK